MLAKLTVDTLQSFHVLVRTPQWAGVDKALRAELLATYERMRDTDHVPTLHELRGRARLLSDILKLASETQERLDARARR